MSKLVGKAWTPNHGSLKYRAITLTSLIFFVTIITLMVKRKPNYRPGSPALYTHNTHSSVTLHPSVEFTIGTDVLSQIPKSPIAVLFIAHGCNGRAANFWDRSDACPNCLGLPEERRIVLDALNRSFAVVAISSKGKCWSFGKEKRIVQSIIKWWLKKNKLEKHPLVALGASSGGYFVSALAAEMKFSSIVVMIAEGVFQRMGVPRGYPPTLFVHMPKDRNRREAIKLNMVTLRQNAVSVKEIQCMEFPLTSNLLSDRIPGLAKNFSAKLFELFIQKGFIDEHGYMKKDGREIQWKQAVEKELSLGKFELFPHVQEELNLAFGYHEMTSLPSDGIFSWYESNLT